jgi:hypothetical protein
LEAVRLLSAYLGRSGGVVAISPLDGVEQVKQWPVSRICQW